MNYETKRDVFEQLLNAHQNLISKDNEIHDENHHVNITTPLNILYDAALPDDLPVIPEAVGEILRLRGQTNLLGVLATAKSGRKVSDTLAWIIDNQNTFARAWVLGVWRVEGTGEIVKLEEEK